MTVPEHIRNLTIVGHRGSGKTSLHEALLFQSGMLSRLGSVAEGTTLSDHDDDERRRSMSISGALGHADWQGCKLNLFDAPGDPSFVADALCSLRVVEGGLFAINGVMGVEVMTRRLWGRCDEIALPRIVFIGQLDRERASFESSLASVQESLSARCVAISIPIGRERDFRGVIDVLHMVAYEDPGGGSREPEPGPIPAELAAEAAEWHDRLIAAVAEVSDDLTERYLEGVEITPDELREALHAEVLRGELYPVACGSATQNIGVRALLDLIVEGVPSPVESVVTARDADGTEHDLGASSPGVAAYAFKTVSDAHVGRINFVRVFAGRLSSDAHIVNGRTGEKERIGQLLGVQGREHKVVSEIGTGDMGAVPKLKDVIAGDLVADHPMMVQGVTLPTPIVSVAVEPAVRGEDDKMGQALRRLAEEDPTMRITRDERTSELLVNGLSQMHVDVTVERVKRRFGVEIVTHPPRVPYFEAIRKPASSRARYKKQTGGRGQFGDCHVSIEPLPGHEGYEFVDKIVGGLIPQGFRPAVDKGIQEAMHAGDLAGYPITGVRVTLLDGSYHTVDSSEMAFKIAGSMAFKKAYEEADPVLLEPIMTVEVTAPSEAVGDVIGDLNQRRGRPLGMDPAGENTTIRAEAPMSELLGYSTDLTSMTGGRGDFSMSLARYEEVPGHVSARLIATLRETHAATRH